MVSGAQAVDHGTAAPPPRRARETPKLPPLARRLLAVNDGLLTLRQLAILSLLAHQPGHNLKQVAAAVQASPMVTCRTIHKLERLGLARRAPDPADGRFVTIDATPAGRALLALVEG